MKRISIMLLATLAAVTALAYLPGNWSNRHANGDFRRADAVIVARVIAINRSQAFVPEGTNTTVAFTYTANVIAARVFRGDVHTNQVLAVPVGGYWQERIDESQPTWVHQCNTQRGFDLEINGVYLMALTKVVEKSGQTNWLPRSGHKSLYKICLNNKMLIRTPSAWTRSGNIAADARQDFGTNSMPLQDFIMEFVTATNAPYPDSDFPKELSTNSHEVTIDIELRQ